MSHRLCSLILAALALVGCGSGRGGAPPIVVVSEVIASNDRGETLSMRSDGSFEYRFIRGAVRGTIHSDGSITDRAGNEVSRCHPDGRVTATAGYFSNVAHHVSPDGTYRIRGQPLLEYDAAGNMIESSSPHEVVLRTSAVPSRLRRATMLAWVTTTMRLYTPSGLPADAAEPIRTDRLATRHKTSFTRSLPRGYVDEIGRLDGVAAVTWMRWYGGQLKTQPREFLTALGADPRTLLDVFDELIVDPTQLAAWKQNPRGL